MPIYEYECPVCGHAEEAFRHIDQRHDAPQHCGKAMDKIITKPMVQTDLPEYLSPVTGKPVRGRRQRTEDLKRSGCRPWEGLEVEKREAKKSRDHEDSKMDAVWEKGVAETYSQMSADKQAALKNAASIIPTE